MHDFPALQSKRNNPIDQSIDLPISRATYVSPPHASFTRRTSVAVTDPNNNAAQLHKTPG